MLRVTVATAGNDHRLGANEAPPAIVSMFLGNEISDVLSAVLADKTEVSKTKGVLETGVESLPTLYKDTTDRNRTSPFAFTGNKFEFRMPGSSQSIAGINIVINASVAKILGEFADALEKSKDVEKDARKLIKDTVAAHKRIIFNGNNYADEWVAEAKKRGLSNFRNTVEALPSYIEPKAVEMLTSTGIFTEKEIHSRYESHLEEYSKLINIEALTMLEMAKKEIIPACISYTDSVLDTLAKKKASGLSMATEREESLAVRLSNLTECLIGKADELEEALVAAKDIEDLYENAKAYREKVFASMQNLRAVADELETIVSSKYWPFPTYTELLFNI